MEKCKLSAKQAFGLARTSGKEWLKNQIFKNIRQAAERGETHLIWDFEPCKYFFDEINDELHSLGYGVGVTEEGISMILDIYWDTEAKIPEWAGMKEREDGTVPLAELLKHRVETAGIHYAAKTAFDLISQAAEEGKNKVKMDVSDISKERVEYLCKIIKRQNLTVSYDEVENFIEISF